MTHAKTRNLTINLTDKNIYFKYWKSNIELFERDLTKRVLEEFIIVCSHINHNWKNLEENENVIKKGTVI